MTPVSSALQIRSGVISPSDIMKSLISFIRPGTTSGGGLIFKTEVTLQKNLNPTSTRFSHKRSLQHTRNGMEFTKISGRSHCHLVIP
jgi:hypothetical protein